MTFTNYSNFDSTLKLTKAVPITVAAFKRLDANDQLGLLWEIYQRMEQEGWIAVATLGTARLKLAQGLLHQIKLMSFSEQLQAMRDLLNKINTPITRAYGLFRNNKLVFWHQLATLIGSGEVVPVPADYKLSPAATEVFNQVMLLDFGRKVQFLRRVVADLGVDPMAI
ncbi:MAG: Orange carotenoid protein [Symploca sp. SIO3C6]|uniref:Orange carotenoid protein n=1 Tax=Symploca sp. SIO1C4 TaxID=2607765 RepID=A0A6B3NEE7_9CYAN|nr:Orange carotenoid protein [Symploca sp. SIO3C6]NER29960.1 Orange carotenoid protein [Symploca sp. SIO1C4]NET05838.1 Orange carotenoid protein [Symploca sp. SIO2B6]